MKVAVTGGTGVVGTPLVRHLAGEDHEVAAMARSADAASDLDRQGAIPVAGNVLEPDTVRRLVEGAEVVFHVAGVNEMCSRDPGFMDRVNIDGTRNVVAACRRAGVRRLVHTSSAAAIGEVPGTVATEASPHRGRYLSRYERSKHLSERLALEESGDLEVVVVNPSSVQGPGRSTGTGKLILDVLNGRLPFLIESRVSVVDIDDCAWGHILAAVNGKDGERYLLSGASFGIGEVVDLLNSVTSRKLRPRFLPGWLAGAGAAAVEFGSRITGNRPVVCREMVRVLRAGHVCDGSRATRELGLGYTPLEVTIRRTIDWFREEGLLL